MSHYVCTKERFLEDVKNHKIQIKKDEGLYRHVVFSKGSFDQRFEIMTWDMNLVICGDMGAYHFSRINDMFKFFGSIDSKKGIEINPSYWSEKLQNKGEVKEFSSEKVAERIDNYIKQYEHDVSCIEEEIKEMKEANSLEGVYSIMNSIDNCSVFDDFELDCTDYQFRYIWCCYAIVWGISKYNEFKEKK